MTKKQQLAEYMKQGNYVHPDLCRKLFGISQTGFHRMLTEFRRANPEYVVEKEKVVTSNSYFNKYKAVRV